MKKRILVITGLSCIIIFFIIKVLFFNDTNHINIKLIGESTINLEVNSDFSDPGATATINNQDFTNQIETKSNLDTSIIGNYQITYSITDNNKTKNITRNIKVIDSTSPTIELQGNQEVKLIVGDTYKDDGYQATDNYDGIITDNVVVNNSVDFNQVGEYEITYTITDSSNNTSSATRKVSILPESEKNTTGIPILMYHFFYDASAGESGSDGNWVEISTFESQMKYLVDNDYYFPSWQEVTDYINGDRNLPNKSIVITADDGNDSYLLKAIPLLEKYNIPSTSFLVTSWSNTFVLENYSSPLVSFQSHSHNMHQSGSDGNGLFLSLSYEEALADVTTSKDILGTSNVFCYPFGHFSDFTKQVLKDAGYSLAVTTEYGKAKQGIDNYQVPRIRINSSDTLESFISKIS